MHDSIRVLLDCTALPVNRGGVGRYIEGLLHGLPPDEISLTIIAQARDAENFSRLFSSATVVALPQLFSNKLARILWEQLGLPGAARRLGADIIHSPHYTFPLLTRLPRVVTLHDATFFSDPSMHGKIKQWFFRNWSRLAWRRASVVVTPSVATATELERFLGAPKATVEVALHGVDSAFFKPPQESDVESLRARLGLQPDESWIAFLGTIEPRKNVPNLIRAYLSLRSELGEDCPLLLIVGGRGWDEEAAQLLDTLDDNTGVRELGYLPLEDLPSLLGAASIVAYPSLGEGFGLPVLEAMACGAVVLTTRKLALPEVGGDAVAYTEPDVEAIKKNMRTLLVDDELTTKLRRQAIERAALLTWEASARVHLRAYHEARSVSHA